MKTVRFSSSSPTILEGRSTAAAAPRSLARSLDSFFPFWGAKRWGFGKGDSGSGIRESRRSERLMLPVGLFLFSSVVVGKLLDYVKSFSVPNRNKKKRKDKAAAAEEEEEEEEEGKKKGLLLLVLHR
jgi:hypothetical protein